MRGEKLTADRLSAYSDAVFAVIVTIMVLELKAPDQASFSALSPLRPTAVRPIEKRAADYLANPGEVHARPTDCFPLFGIVQIT